VLFSLAVLCFAEDAKRLSEAGEKAARAGDTVQAFLLYSRAAQLDPANLNYAQREAALKTTGALTPTQRYEPDPADETLGTAFAAETATGRDYLESQKAEAPPRLIGSAEKKTFDLKGDARTVIEKVLNAYGLLVVFEADYQPPPSLTFRISDVGYQEALRALEEAANSFLVPVNSRLAIVARDTPQKRAEMSPVMVLAVPIPQRLSVQEAQEIVTAVQQTLDIRRISVDAGRHMVYIRDQVSKVYAARRMLENLSHPRAQVSVEVELLSTSKTSSLSYGMTLPNSIALVNFGTELGNTPSLPSGVANFLTFGGGATLLGLGITNASAFATVANASANSLLRAELVTADGQPASLHIGDRYPVIQTGYYGTTTGTGTTYAPPPTVNFVDLGLVLKLTTSVNEGNDVTLDVDAEYKELGAVGANGIPAIGSRVYQGKVRLKDGEWAVIAGLVTTTDSIVKTGIPGLMSLPLLGRFFSSTSPEKDSTTTLIVLKPHVAVSPPWDDVPVPIWVGTETRPLSVF